MLNYRVFMTQFRLISIGFEQTRFDFLYSQVSALKRIQFCTVMG